MKYVDCKSYAQEILDEVKAVDHKDELWILSMGDNPASESYIKGKLKDANYCGVPCSYIKVNDADLLERHIRKGNNSVTVRGIMIQLPLPEGVDTDYYLNSIGIYKDIEDKSSFISRLTASQADELLSSGFIGGGMLPKLTNCISAIRNGVNRVHILDGRIAHSLLVEIFTNEGIGTAIVSDEEEDNV